MGGAAASRIPPAWGFTRDEAFELAGGSRPGSHWDEERWNELHNDEGLIPPKQWKAEVARVNQEVMDEMLRQQAEAARKAALAKAAAEEKKRKAAEAAAEAKLQDEQRLQALEEQKAAAVEEEKRRKFELANPLRKIECVHELKDAGEDNIVRCVAVSEPIVEQDLDNVCDEILQRIATLDDEVAALEIEREEFVARRKKASADKRQAAILKKQAQKRQLRAEIRHRLGKSGWMAAFAYDDTAHVVDLKSGKSLTTLRGHSGCINSLTFSPDRSKIVTASMDGLAIVWNISSPGFAVGATVESRAVAEIDLKFPDKPPCITAGSEWFKGVLGNIRDEGNGTQSYDVCFDEERRVPTNMRNMAPTIIRTCPVNDAILAEFAAEQAAAQEDASDEGKANEASAGALEDDDDSDDEPQIDISKLSGRERRAYERQQKKKAEEAELQAQLEDAAEEEALEKQEEKRSGSKEPSGIPPWLDTFALELGTAVESVYRGTEDWALAQVTHIWEVSLEGAAEREAAWRAAEQAKLNAIEMNKTSSQVESGGCIEAPGGIVSTVRTLQSKPRQDETKQEVELLYSPVFGLDYTYTYDIEYQRGRLKGKVERKKSRAELRRVFETEDRVACRYRDGETWLEARVIFVRKNRTYDIKYDTGLRENCVPRERMRKGLAVGDSVMCAVKRDTIAAAKAAETSAAIAKQQEEEEERKIRNSGGNAVEQQRMRRRFQRQKQLEAAAAANEASKRQQMKRGKVLKIRELSYDVLFDEPDTQNRLPQSYYNRRLDQHVVVVRPIAQVHQELLHPQGVSDVDYHPKKHIVCTASGDEVFLWYTTNGARAGSLRAGAGESGEKAAGQKIRRRSTAAEADAALRKADRLVGDTADVDGQIEPQNEKKVPRKWLLTCKFSAGAGDAVVAAGHSDFIYVFDWQKQQQIRKILTHEGPTSSHGLGMVYSLGWCFLCNVDHALFARHSHTNMYNTIPTLLMLVPAPTSTIWTGHEMPSFVATISHDKTLRVWDPSTKLMKEVSTGGYAQFFTERPSGQHSSFNTPAVTMDSKWVFAGGPGGTLRAWEIATGKMIHNDASAHEAYVSCVAVAPTTKHLQEFWMVTGGVDGVCKIWTCDFGIDPAGASEEELQADRKAIAQAGASDKH